MNNIIIYTDGAYSSSRNQGGVGVIILKNNKKIFEYSNMYKNCTNNQMELGAIIIALRLIKNKYNSITIYSDSMYCIGCITLNWQRKKNKALWSEFDKQLERVKELCPTIEFIHVKGHADNQWNNECDRLARNASMFI